MTARWQQIRGSVAAVRRMLGLAWQSDRRFVAASFVLEAVQGALPLASAWLTKSIFDLIIEAARSGRISESLSRLLALQIGLAGVALLGVVAGLAATFVVSELGRALTLRVQAIVFGRLNELEGVAPFEDPAFQETLHLASQGAQSGPRQALQVCGTSWQSLVTLGGFLGVLLALSVPLTLLVVCSAVPQLYVQLALGRQHFDLSRRNSPRVRMASYLRGVLSGIGFAKEVRLFGLGDYFLARLQELTGKIQSEEKEQQRLEMRSRVKLALLGNGVASVCFFFVSYLAVAGRITVGDVALYVGAVASVQGALSSLVSMVSGLNESILFFDRFTRLQGTAQPLAAHEPKLPVPVLEKGFEIRGLSFRYHEQQDWILRDLNLAIPAGRSLALVGLNGAGKTTLVKLMTRLYDPVEGEILWDGKDLRCFRPADLRRSIGVVMQDFARYDLTVRENIGLGEVDRIGDEAAIREAAGAAGAHEMVENLSEGYDTLLGRFVVGDRRAGDLSGGQWQKIAIARTFMRRADLLILDEPTAALDAQAEEEVYQRFLELARGKTCLLISHRLSTVRRADRIAVLEKGSIVELGSHDELMALGGRYAKLYALQRDRYLDAAAAPPLQDEMPVRELPPGAVRRRH